MRRTLAWVLLFSVTPLMVAGMVVAIVCDACVHGMEQVEEWANGE